MIRFLFKIIFAIIWFGNIAIAQVPDVEKADKNSLKTPKVGSLVAAAMETAGSALQSDFLDFLSGQGEFKDSQSGQLISGLLYLIALVTALVTLASGGQYKWARYLLVGPPLFFFLTQVRIASDGADWVFGDAEFPKDVKEKMLRGVKHFDEGQRKGGDVALFYQFWNVFISDVTQTLVTQLNRTKNDRHLNFIEKFDNYLLFWNYSHITDQNLRVLIHTVMMPSCTEFFALKRKIATESTPDFIRNQLKVRLSEIEENPVRVFVRNQNDEGSEIEQRWLEAGMVKDGKASCKDIWNWTVEYLREPIAEMIAIHLRPEGPGQKADPIKKLFLDKIGVPTNKLSGEITYKQNEANLDLAINWIIARSLFLEIWSNNPFANTFEFEGREEIRGTGMGNGRNQGEVLDATDMIQQFNVSDVYKQRGDYLAAALSMPNFQGILLMMLSAAYPFFALMVVVPGRAGAMLTWMSLWAWVKLWDLGFAVVMLIDDILYALFPRGPNISPEQLKDPGEAWSRVLEVDPNYSSATYYNLLATCLFAVPVVTGLFVKGGAKELVNIVHGSWQTKASMLGNSAGGFAGTLQSQTYADIHQKELLQNALQAQREAIHGFEATAVRQSIGELQDAMTGAEMAKKTGLLAKLGHKNLVGLTDLAANELLKEEIEAKRRHHYNLLMLAGNKAAYEYANSSRGFYLSESAVAAGYASHHFNYKHYIESELTLEFSRSNMSELQLEVELTPGKKETINFAERYGNDYDSVKQRYDQINQQLQDGNLTPEQRKALQAEADGLAPTAKNVTLNRMSAQYFNQAEAMGKALDGGLNLLINAAPPGGLSSGGN